MFENERGFDAINWPVKKTIDITPTWSAVLPLLIHSIQNGSNINIVTEELKKMAKAADKYNEMIK